jgi:glycosyltransferase involved in cell wall biosynthesis
VSVPKILLITGTLPYSYGVGGIILGDLCDLYPRDHLCCFADASTDFSVPAWLPTTYATKLHFPGYHFLRRARFTFLRRIAEGIDQLDARYRRWPGIVHDVVKLGQAHQVDIVWAVLDSPMTIYLAAKVAARLSVPLHAQIWEPAERVGQLNQVNRLLVGLLLRDFDRTIQYARCCAVVSEAMRNEYQTVSPRTIIVRHGLEEKHWRPPSDSLHDDSQLVIGFAGSLYASQEWIALIRALNEVNWRIHDRDVKIVLLSQRCPVITSQAAHIEYYGWRPVAQVLEILSRADILYLPYWLDPQYETTVKLAFPTKLSTYLAVGKPVLYHGPADSSPAHFMHMYPFGYMCNSLESEEILHVLSRFSIEHTEYRIMAAQTHIAREEELSFARFKRSFAEFIGVSEDSLVAPSVN